MVDGRYLLRDYEDRLGKAKVGSASIAFRRLDDIDVNVLVEFGRRGRPVGLVSEAESGCR